MVIYISTPEQLQAVSTNLTAEYQLVNDIDLKDFHFRTIGKGGRFRGKFNGNGFLIKNLTLNETEVETGLFGDLTNANVTNLGILNANVTGTGEVGIIAGRSSGTTTISNCYTTGSVTGDNLTGGIVGYDIGAKYNDCYTHANVTGNTFTGGLSGYALGSWSGCYVASSVTGTDQSLTGAITGTNAGTFTNCYFNADLTQSSPVGTALTTAQMKSGASFKGMSITIWEYMEGKYPYLTSLGEPIQEEPTIPAKNEIVNVSSHLNIISSVLERSKRKVSINLTHVGNVTGQAIRLPHVLKNVTSHIDELVSSVTAFENANMKDYTVTSYVDDITGKADRKVKTVRSVTSYAQPLHIVSDIIIPLDVEQPVYANVYVVDNLSAVNVECNKTVTNKIQNRTEMSVI